jgi:glutaminyl-peptide cyclotransferase
MKLRLLLALLVAIAIGAGLWFWLGPVPAGVLGGNALAHTESILLLGPRPPGSPALEQTRTLLCSELAKPGWHCREDAFERTTPVGRIRFANLRARFGTATDAALWERPVDGLLCCHIDSKLIPNVRFLGADDAASAAGAILGIARVLAEDQPKLAKRLELVFFDGEEAFGTNITASDGLYGSKHYAAQWLLAPEADRPRWGVLLDMVGDIELNIRAAVRIPRQSIRDLAKAREDGAQVVDIVEVEENLQHFSRHLLDAADELGLREFIGISPDYIIDDHIPLNVVSGIPTINLIDFDYAPWHTPADTLDKVSEGSLEISGRVTLRLVEKYLLGTR